ncbi:hypothetical protein ABG79_00845 [Caloramator mitchellensis]|uniref:Uncharacterized protein n=1 Tax=Caloramator mitchellensis TaxID=908809 RepID=A0A0R3K3J9_CALMK|nr:hypothetical protein [Caloramator mitchellensis]KRQ87506.1 hypothetical protein ABG79_00845 [Caloramator mitchellensis]
MHCDEKDNIEMNVDSNIETEENFQNEIMTRYQNKMNIEQSFNSGVNWFYWIAALSFFNSIAFIAGYNWSFIFGLGITQLIDYILYEMFGKISFIAIILDLITAGMFIIVGYFAKRYRKNWIIVIGLILYTLDAFIFIFVADWLSVAFHAWAIYGIFKAISANRKLSEIERA